MDEAQKQYQADAVYDMEASGFFSAAMRFGTVELIHCAKIISDNTEQPIENISRNEVLQWVEDNLQKVECLVSQLLDIVVSLDADNKGKKEYEFLLDKYHLTSSQQTQLKSLLQSWYTLSDASVLELVQGREIPNTKALLRLLETKINAAPLSF